MRTVGDAMRRVEGSGGRGSANVCFTIIIRKSRYELGPRIWRGVIIIIWPLMAWKIQFYCGICSSFCSCSRGPLALYCCYYYDLLFLRNKNELLPVPPSLPQQSLLSYFNGGINSFSSAACSPRNSVRSKEAAEIC